MPKYSVERREAVLSKLLSSNSQSFAEISREEGISVQTLYDWRNKARRSGVLMPNSDSSNQELCPNLVYEAFSSSGLGLI